jgi:hypothetical protein
MRTNNFITSRSNDQDQIVQEDFDIHEECKHQCIPSILLQYMELHPESLAKVDDQGCLPLHVLLTNTNCASASEIPLILLMAMMEKYPAALQHPDNSNGYLPLHIECYNQCRSAVIATCIELYPEALTIADRWGYLPLHRLLDNQSSSLADALMMIDKYPAAISHHKNECDLAVHLECNCQYRPAIVMKCIELYPEALDNYTINKIIQQVKRRRLQAFSDVVRFLIIDSPMSLYDCRNPYINDDIRKDPDCRRRILRMLPRYVFTSTHDEDFRDLNWTPRAAMMMLLSQMKMYSAQQQGSSSPSNRNRNAAA